MFFQPGDVLVLFLMVAFCLAIVSSFATFRLKVTYKQVGELWGPYKWPYKLVTGTISPLFLVDFLITPTYNW